MNPLAIAKRVLDTLERDASLQAAVGSFEVGDRPKYEYGERFPLVRASPSRAPVHRRIVGTLGNPDRHPPVETTVPIEVAVVTAVSATNEMAQESAWAIAGLVEGALARNARLADADGGDRLCHTLKVMTKRRHGPNIGTDREALTVVAMASILEDLGALPNSGEGA